MSDNRTIKSRYGRAILVAAVALTSAACSGDVGWLSKPELKAPEFKAPEWNITRPEWNLNAKNAPKARVVTAGDLIGPGGCGIAPAAPSPQALNFQAGPPAPGSPQAAPDATPTPETPAAPLVRGVALGMTECEVVQAIGLTDRVEISTSPQGERSVVLTYAQGPRPGTYRFTAGLLVSIERGPEPPAAPPKPTKKKKAAKAKTPS